MTFRAVTSYVNPDTDGVVCMLAYESLVRASEKSFDGIIIPIIFGTVNPETDVALRRTESILPLKGDAPGLADADEICLVDTHHKSQLFDGFPFGKVVEVIDHHSGGDVLPRGARLQNEAVGAAATLIVERLQAVNFVPPAQLVLLLGAGILSNTLDFRAPSTTNRDRLAFGWVQAHAAWPPTLGTEMYEARGRLLSGSTLRVLDADVKLFRTKDGRCAAISQVEAANASVIAERDDLKEALAAVTALRRADTVVVNLVDLSVGRSLLICPDKWTRAVLEEQYGVVFDPQHRAWADGLFLRKTHLVPTLIA